MVGPVLDNGKSEEWTLLRTLSAGDGFLAQSSKWIHVGLGSSKNVKRLIVHWPGGDAEEFTGIKANRRYRLVQGSGHAETWDRPNRTVVLPRSRLVEPNAGQTAPIRSVSLLPLPRLAYQSFDGQQRIIQQRSSENPQSAPVLLNVWASWCAPCLRELTDWTKHQERIRASGVEVVALSVDGLDPQQGTTSVAAKDTIERLGFPFEAGMATAATIDKLQMTHDHIFDAHRPLPVPTSVLIDAQGNLAATYKGHVELELILEDVSTLASPTPDPVRTLPMQTGRWFDRRKSLNPLDLVWKLVEQDYLDEALEYLEHNEARLAQHYNFHKLLVLVGNGRLARGEVEQAVGLYRAALDILPSYVDAQNNLAWLLATHANEQIRDGNDAVRYAEMAVGTTSGNVPSLLDTLAAAYAEDGRFEQAIATAKKAIELAQANTQPQLARKIERRLQLYEASQPYRAN